MITVHELQSILKQREDEIVPLDLKNRVFSLLDERFDLRKWFIHQANHGREWATLRFSYLESFLYQKDESDSNGLDSESINFYYKKLPTIFIEYFQLKDAIYRFFPGMLILDKGVQFRWDIEDPLNTLVSR